MSPKILLLILSLSMLLSSVQAVLSVTYAATNPYCAAPGELTLSVKDEDAASQDIEFDAIGTYYDANKESIPLMVKNGNPSGPSDFTFYSYSNNLAGTTARVCSGTAAFTFIDLVGSYLFLYDSGSSTYFFCKFNPSASSTPKALSITGLVPRPSPNSTHTSPMKPLFMSWSATVTILKLLLMTRPQAQTQSSGKK